MDQEIMCDVCECAHHKGENGCALRGIQVSNTVNDVSDKEDTGCMSFECS